MTRKSGPVGGIFGANTRTVATRVGDMSYVKHDQFIGRSLNLYGEWAQIEIDKILGYVAPGDFVIDVGANIGFHALSFARKVGKSGTVWAFEPDPVNGLLLRHNILQAALDDVVIPFDLALSDELGVRRFRTHPISAPENFGHTAIDALEGEYPRVSVPLDALSLDRAPALIKIDIEGHELPAIGGMIELIERHRPVLSIEADTLEEIEANGALAASLGYDVYSFVVNAYNPSNFAENATDIWKGHGRCANLLCVIAGKHRAPDDLDLIRRADIERQAISRLGKTVGAAYSAVPVGEQRSGDVPVHVALGATQADIKRFVSGFLKTTYGKLDPVSDAALVNSALDFLAANGPSAEGMALQRLIVAGVESFAEALGGRVTADELAEARAERDQLRADAGELRANIARLAEERQHLGAQHDLAVKDLSSRLGAASAAEARLISELAQQAETGRREVSTANAKAAEAEQRASDAEKQRAELASAYIMLQGDLKAANDTLDRLTRELEEAQARVMALTALESDLKAANEARDQLEAALAEARDQLAQDRSKLADALQVAHEATAQRGRDIAELHDNARGLAEALASTERERDKLLSELSEAQGRLALQAQQLRHLRATQG